MLFLLSEVTYDSEIKWCLLKNPPANAGDVGSIPGSGRSPGEGNGNPLTPVFLPGKFHGQRSLVGYSSWDHRVGHNLAIKKQQHDKQVLFVPP